MFKNYLIIAIRNQLKRKVFSLINIVGLGIGMAASLLILNYVTFETSYDDMHVKKDHIYRVTSKFYEGKVETEHLATSSFGYGTAMINELPGIKNMVRVAMHENEQVVSYEDIKFRERKVYFADSTFFNLFSYPLINGEPGEVLSRPNTVVISRSAAQRFFKNEDPMGKLLKIRTQQLERDLEVSGVFEDMPANSNLHMDYLISWETLAPWIRDFWYLHEVYTYVELESEEYVAAIEEGFPVLAEKYKTNMALKNKIWAIDLEPLEEIHLLPSKPYEREVKGNAKVVNVLILVAIVIMLIAWINYINLTTARSLERAKEVGVRKVSGSKRRQLIYQFMIESMLVNMLALLITFTILQVSFSTFNALTGKVLSFSLWSNFSFWMWLVVVFITGSVLAGLYPAFVLSSVKPIVVLKGKYNHSRGGGLLRKGLVVLQFVASLILIAGTLIVSKQVDYMRNQDLGVNINQILAVQFPAHSPNMQQRMTSLRQRLATFPEVENVTISGVVPGKEVGFLLANRRVEEDERFNRLYEMLPVGYDFIDIYELEVIAGRGFSRDFGGDRERLVINEESVKNLGFTTNEEAIGARIMLEFGGEPMEVIGVIKNYHQQSLQKGFTPIMMLMHDKNDWLSPRYLSVKVDGEQALQTLKKVKEVWIEYFADSTFDYFFLDSFFEEQYRADRRFGTIFTVFALLAVFIACMGLWGVAMYEGILRTKEIGIRKVMGSGTVDIFLLLARDFMNPVGLAVILGAPLAYYIMDSWLDQYAFRIAMSAWYLLIPALILIIISMATLASHTFKT
ncbi:MAG: ABC transporter permease, partial [Marinilabiliaceae bacterium]|nr:ABC transporter permease [Marinilabiliaceae bacterium]